MTEDQPAPAEAPAEDMFTVTHHWRPAGYRGAWREVTTGELSAAEAVAFIEAAEHV